MLVLLDLNFLRPHQRLATELELPDDYPVFARRHQHNPMRPGVPLHDLLGIVGLDDTPLIQRLDFVGEFDLDGRPQGNALLGALLMHNFLWENQPLALKSIALHREVVFARRDFRRELTFMCLRDVALCADFQKAKGGWRSRTVSSSDFQFRGRHGVHRQDCRLRGSGEADDVNIVGGVEVVAVGLSNDVVMLLAGVTECYLGSPQLERFQVAGFHDFYQRLAAGTRLVVGSVGIYADTNVAGSFFAQVADDEGHGDVFAWFGGGRQESVFFAGCSEKADIRAGVVELGRFLGQNSVGFLLILGHYQALEKRVAVAAVRAARKSERFTGKGILERRRIGARGRRR